MPFYFRARYTFKYWYLNNHILSQGMQAKVFLNKAGQYMSKETLIIYESILWVGKFRWHVQHRAETNALYTLFFNLNIFTFFPPSKTGEMATGTDPSWVQWVQLNPHGFAEKTDFYRKTTKCLYRKAPNYTSHYTL